MGRKSKRITDENESYILKNYESLTPSEISHNQRIPYCSVYNYMQRNKIPILHSREKQVAHEKKKPNTSGFFDVGERENWMI